MDGVLVVLISNQLNIDMIVHQMGDGCVSHLVSYIMVNKSCNIYITGSHQSTLGVSYWPKFFVV